MDPLSQAVLGAGLAGACANTQTVRRAMACGAIGGLTPDLDVFIRSGTDPLLGIEYHRHFTHALAFAPIAAIAVACFMWLLMRKKLPFRQVYLFSLLGYLTHGPLDAMTSYGTRLYWPFSQERIAWDAISIIDPLFTVPLLVFVLLAIWKDSVKFVRIGFTIGCCYLALGLTQHARVYHHMADLAESRGHSVDRYKLNPTFANLLLWRAVYQSGDEYHVDAIRMPFWEAPTVYAGKSVPAVPPELMYPNLPLDSQQKRDIMRFAHFSQYFVYQREDGIIMDLRYGLLPNETDSLWGLKVDPTKPDEYATFSHMRNFNDKRLETFHAMLKGTF